METSPRISLHAATVDDHGPEPGSRLSSLLSQRLRTGTASVELKDAFKISDLPEYVGAKLAHFDVDGDGMISIEEILQAGAEVEHLRYKARGACA